LVIVAIDVMGLEVMANEIAGVEMHSEVILKKSGLVVPIGKISSKLLLYFKALYENLATAGYSN